MKKDTLQVNGRVMSFTASMYQGYYYNGYCNENPKIILTEGEWFEVNPQAINQKHFRIPRTEYSWKQEKARQLILEAFAEWENHPEKYGRTFETMMPEKTWEYKTYAELEELACGFGAHNADWVEQALEWAQRICNGESWDKVCDRFDTANWYRIIIWKDGLLRKVGGASNFVNIHSAVDIHRDCILKDSEVGNTVPLIARYK